MLKQYGRVGSLFFSGDPPPQCNCLKTCFEEKSLGRGYTCSSRLSESNFSDVRNWNVKSRAKLPWVILDLFNSKPLPGSVFDLIAF